MSTDESKPEQSAVPTCPDDVCECGDYRKQHVKGFAKCRVCGDSKAPYDGCMKFRLAVRGVAGEAAPPKLEVTKLIAELQELATYRGNSALDAGYRIVASELQSILNRWYGDGSAAASVSAPLEQLWYLDTSKGPAIGYYENGEWHPIAEWKPVSDEGQSAPTYDWRELGICPHFKEPHNRPVCDMLHGHDAWEAWKKLEPPAGAGSGDDQLDEMVSAFTRVYKPVSKSEVRSRILAYTAALKEKLDAGREKNEKLLAMNSELEDEVKALAAENQRLRQADFAQIAKNLSAQLKSAGADVHPSKLEMWLEREWERRLASCALCDLAALQQKLGAANEQVSQAGHISNSSTIYIERNEYESMKAENETLHTEVRSVAAENRRLRQAWKTIHDQINDGLYESAMFSIKTLLASEAGKEKA